MATELRPKQQLRLARILEMLGSPNDCERAVAAKMATAFIKEHGLMWIDLTAHLSSKVGQGPLKIDPSPESPRRGTGYQSQSQANSGRLLDYYG